MKITIEGTVEEFKEFGTTYEGIAKCGTITETVVNTNDGITTEGDWIVFRYKGKEWSLYKENEKKSDGDEYFTYDEAIEFCKELEDRHLPSIEERQELLKAWCEYKGYVIDGNAVYSSDNEADDIGEEFANDFKLPFAGYRYSRSASVNYQGSLASYWSSTPYPNDDSAYSLYFSNSNVNPQCSSNRAGGNSVRCFKNSYGS